MLIDGVRLECCLAGCELLSAALHLRSPPFVLAAYVHYKIFSKDNGQAKRIRENLDAEIARNMK